MVASGVSVSLGFKQPLIGRCLSRLVAGNLFLAEIWLGQTTEGLDELGLSGVLIGNELDGSVGKVPCKLMLLWTGTSTGQGLLAIGTTTFTAESVKK